MHRRAFLAAACGAAVLPGSVWAQADLGDDLIRPILAETGAPALAGMVVTRDGVAWMAADGLRRAGGVDRVTTEDKWHLGSNGKAMTAALYARLVEQGRARWEARLVELFPRLKSEPAWFGATVEQFLTQRAGLSDAGLIDPAWLLSAHTDPRSLPDQRRALSAKALGKPPGGKPDAFEYANANYVLAGAGMEQLTGTDWETALRTELFAPLGMDSAGFGAPDGDQPWGHANGAAVDPLQPGADNPPALGPAGTVHMTLADYAKFLRLFLTDGGGVLEPASIATLTAPYGGQANAYAMGWGTFERRTWGQGPVIWHQGSNGRWFASTLAAPARGLAVVAVSNDFARGQKAVNALVPKLIDRFARA